MIILYTKKHFIKFSTNKAEMKWNSFNPIKDIKKKKTNKQTKKTANNILNVKGQNFPPKITNKTKMSTL